LTQRERFDSLSSMHKEEKSNIKCKKSKINRSIQTFVSFIFVACAVLGLGRLGEAKGQVSDDSRGVVLGAHIARSSQEKDTLLPVETYFGNPAYASTEEQLKALQVTVNPEDKTAVFPDPLLRIGTVIRITRATPVTVVDGKTSMLYRTWTTTVKALFDEKKIDVGSDDSVSVKGDATLTLQMTITITRVQITHVTTREPIDYKTVNKDDPTLEKGVTKTQQQGKKGVRTKVFEVRRENGTEVSRTLKDNTVTQEPVEAIIIHGTKVVLLGEGIATWFGAPSLSAAHNSLPRGTKVLVTNVENGKSVTVTIIGGGIQGRAIIDLSPDAFKQLAPLGDGIMQVRLTKP